MPAWVEIRRNVASGADGPAQNRRPAHGLPIGLQRLACGGGDAQDACRDPAEGRLHIADWDCRGPQRLIETGQGDVSACAISVAECFAEGLHEPVPSIGRLEFLRGS